MDKPPSLEPAQKPNWLYSLQGKVPSPGPTKPHLIWKGVLVCCVAFLIVTNSGDPSDYLSRISINCWLGLGCLVSLIGLYSTRLGLCPASDELFAQLLIQKATADSYSRKWNANDIKLLEYWLHRANNEANEVSELIKQQREKNFITRQMHQNNSGQVEGPLPVLEAKDYYLAVLFREAKQRFYETGKTDRNAGEAASLQIEVSIAQIENREI